MDYQTYDSEIFLLQHILITGVGFCKISSIGTGTKSPDFWAFGVEGGEPKDCIWESSIWGSKTTIPGDGRTTKGCGSCSFEESLRFFFARADFFEDFCIPGVGFLCFFDLVRTILLNLQRAFKQRKNKSQKISKEIYENWDLGFWQTKLIEWISQTNFG